LIQIADRPQAPSSPHILPSILSHPLSLPTKRHPQKTGYLVGTGGVRLKALEEEHECAIVITGLGSGSRDRKLPGHGLPHLLVTMTGTDVRSLGRLRRSFEHRLINYVIVNSFANKRVDVEGGGENGEEKVVRPPPSLGRLLYCLGISAADSSPRTKDRRPDRTVLAQSPTLPSLYDRLRHEGGDDDGLETEFKTKKVWMNVCELPQDPTTLEHHGRFLASKSLRTYYREHFKCRVDVFGVWGDGGEGLRGGVEDMMCAPYVMVTSDAKVNVDKCLVHIEHRIREHEEKFKMKRACGRRVLKGEKPQSSMESSLETGLSTPRK